MVGAGATTPRVTPARVGAEADWTAISAGDDRACGLGAGGALWCWGWNAYAQLGTGDQVDRHAPVQIGAGATWIAVAAGLIDTCALRADGSAWCWGWNGYGEAGVGAPGM